MARMHGAPVLCRQEPALPAKGRIVRPVAGKRRLSIPNIITLGRILLVPIIVWAIASSQMEIAFAIFVIAGVSDAVDGFLAKRFNLTSELGAYLDPLADKALLASIYITLAVIGALSPAIAILVVSRDLMILFAVVVSWLMDKPVEIRPVFVSKFNTVAQIAFAALLLGARAFGFEVVFVQEVLGWVVACSTLASGAVYIAQWLEHMSR